MFELSPLPYSDSALEPHLSAKMFSFHHQKHHLAYINNLNNLVKDKAELQGKGLVDIIKASAGKADMAGVFNNAAQIWNHDFYWHSMSPKGGGKPSGDLLKHIEQDFGSFEEFATQFKTAGTTQFGSGWAWLVLDSGKLKVTKTANADLPMAHGQTALLTIDVWEHAYYIDYQNRRPDYIGVFLEKLINWEFAANNLKNA